MIYSPLIRRALQTSAEAHAGQVRKGTQIPYIIHPVGVMLLLMEYDPNPQLLAAALLHDVLEDRSEVYPEARMRREYGPDITGIVLAVTKDSRIADWRARNEDYLARVRASGDPRAVLLMCADKINNLTDMLADHAALGPRSWDRFNAGLEEQKWWYRSVRDTMAELLPGHPLAVRLGVLVGELERI